jgi:hypothetical protein
MISTIFYVIGGVTAAWALLVSAIGIKREGFPRSQRTTRLTMAISLALVAASIAAAIVTGGLEEERPGEAEHGAVDAAGAAS